jgi:hypothetical protein
MLDDAIMVAGATVQQYGRSLTDENHEHHPRR